MFLSSVLRNALLILVPLSFLLSSYLYLYPAFHLCAFPSPEQDANSEYLNTLRQHTPFASHGSLGTDGNLGETWETWAKSETWGQKGGVVE